MFTSALALAAALLSAPPAKTPAAPKPSPPAAGPVLHAYAGLVLAPDASKVASVESAGVGEGGAIVVRSAADGAVLQRLDPCAGKCRYADLAWSPDGARLAFVQSPKAGATVSLMVAPLGGPLGAATQSRVVATLTGVLQTPRWSADGRTLAALVVQNPRKKTGATQAGAARVGEFSDSAVDEQRIAVVPASGGALRLVSPADTFVYEYDWTPDGAGFVATAAKGDGDNNWWVAKLEAFGLDGSERVVAAPKTQMNFPRVSADGKTVAFIGGLMSDFGSVGGDVYSVPLTGGQPKDLTPGYRGTFTSIVWRGSTIRGSALIGPDNALVAIDPATGAVDVALKTPASFSAGDGEVSYSADGRTVVSAAQTFTAPQEIHALDASGPRILTHENDALKPVVSAKNVEWTHDGERVQGWLVGPSSPAPGKTYPMIVLVHGGPAAAISPRYVAAGREISTLVEHGYYVFQPNPRGSYGQGEAFVQLNRRDFGGADLGDILAGVDAAEKVAPIDDKRLGLFGHSYGGFMTMWGVTHTDRFKAAVAGAGIADWVSYYGENGIDQWMIPYFGASAYDDPKIYDKLSPIRYIHAAKTPTFIYVGERDIECPADQSIQFWHGLKAMGVPTSLVIYEGEGHGIRKPEHTKDLVTRTLNWFDQHLGS